MTRIYIVVLPGNTHAVLLRFLFIIKPHTPSMKPLRFLHSHWPNLRFHIEWREGVSDAASKEETLNDLKLTVYSPVRSSTLHQVLRMAFVKPEFGTEPVTQMHKVKGNISVFFRSGGRIVSDPAKRCLNTSSADSIAVQFDRRDASLSVLQSLRELLSWLQGPTASDQSGSSVVVRGEAPVKLLLIEVGFEQVIPLVIQVSYLFEIHEH